jgi:hypothetical protein
MRLAGGARGRAGSRAAATDEGRPVRTRHDRITEAGHRLDGLRAGEPGPDPRFRAMLRERLVTAAGGDPASDEGRNNPRNDGRNGHID